MRLTRYAMAALMLGAVPTAQAAPVLPNFLKAVPQTQDPATVSLRGSSAMRMSLIAPKADTTPEAIRRLKRLQAGAAPRQAIPPKPFYSDGDITAARLQGYMRAFAPEAYVPLSDEAEPDPEWTGLELWRGWDTPLRKPSRHSYFASPKLRAGTLLAHEAEDFTQATIVLASASTGQSEAIAAWVPRVSTKDAVAAGNYVLSAMVKSPKLQLNVRGHSMAQAAEGQRVYYMGQAVPMDPSACTRGQNGTAGAGDGPVFADDGALYGTLDDTPQNPLRSGQNGAGGGGNSGPLMAALGGMSVEDMLASMEDESDTVSAAPSLLETVEASLDDPNRAGGIGTDGDGDDLLASLGDDGVSGDQGQGSLISNSNDSRSASANAAATSAVPVPSTMWLFSVGLIGFGIARKARQSRGQ